MHRILGRIVLCSALCCAALPAFSQTSLSLEQALALARSGSEAIRLKELALQKSRLTVDEARARALPQIGLSTSASYLVNPPDGYTVKAGSLGSFSPTIPANALYPGSPAVSLGTLSLPSSDLNIGAQEHDYFSLGLTLTQSLFTWGKIKNAIDAASLQADSASTDLTAQERRIDREVHRAYHGAILARDSHAILARIRETAAQIVTDREKSFEQGTITKESVLEAQSSLAAIEAKLTEAQQSGATALESLGILTGLDPDSITLTTGFSDGLPALDEDSLRDKALKQSTDLAERRTTVSLAQKKLDIEKGGALLHPDVGLSASLDVTGDEDLPYKEWSWSSDAWSWDLIISLGVKMSVFDGLSSQARIGQAEKDVEMASTGLSQTEKLVRLAVRTAVDAATKADAEAKEKQAKAAYAAERLKNARASLENGFASRTDVYGADILDGTARLDLLYSLYTRDEAVADIEALIGEKLPEAAQ